MKKLLFILPLLYYSCTDEIVSDIDSILTENAEQDAQIDSLMTVLTQQQEYIDSLNNAQNIADSLDNLAMQSYIDSLINLGNVSDSLLQVYTDSLNTVQNTYIDSLHNAQQTTLEALANSALSAGFVEMQVYSESINLTNSYESIWQDLDLSLITGNNISVVLIKFIQEASNGNSLRVDMQTNGLGGYAAENLQAGSGIPYYFIRNTDSSGIIEWGYRNTFSATTNVTISVVFYLN